MAYLFNGYWEDIGTIASFFESNISLTHNVSAREGSLVDSGLDHFP